MYIGRSQDLHDDKFLMQHPFREMSQESFYEDNLSFGSHQSHLSIFSQDQELFRTKSMSSMHSLASPQSNSSIKRELKSKSSWDLTGEPTCSPPGSPMVNRRNFPLKRSLRRMKILDQLRKIPDHGEEVYHTIHYNPPDRRKPKKPLVGYQDDVYYTIQGGLRDPTPHHQQQIPMDYIPPYAVFEEPHMHQPPSRSTSNRSLFNRSSYYNMIPHYPAHHRFPYMYYPPSHHYPYVPNTMMTNPYHHMWTVSHY